MANATTNVGFQSPSYDYAADLSEIERRKALSAALQQQSMQTEPTQSVNGWAVRQSPYAGLLKVLQGAAGGYGQSQAEGKQRELSAKARQDLADVLRQGGQAAAGAPAIPQPAPELGGGPGAPAQAPDMARAAEIYMQHPQTAQMGMGVAQKNMENQQRQAMLAKILGPQGPQGMPPQAPQEAQGPSPQSAAAVGAPWAAGAPQQGGMDPRVMALLMSGDAGLSAVGQQMGKVGEAHRGVEYDQEGRAFVTTKGGQPMYLPGIKARDKLQPVNLGGSTAFVNPFTQNTPLQHTLTPDQAARLPMEQGRFQFETGMPPPGMGQAAPAGPAPAPGAAPRPQAAPQPAPAPADGMTPQARAQLAKKRADEMPQAKQSVELQGQDLDRLTSIANELKTHAGLSRASGMVGKLPSIPGGKAAGAESLIDSLKAQVSGIKLQAMRNASKTGGAVGNVTEKEWPRLENMITALDPVKMGKETFQAKLDELVTEMGKMKKSLNDAFANEYGQKVSTGSLSAEEARELESLRKKYGR